MVSPVELQAQPTIESLQKLITALRAEDGCPWDRKQTPSSLTVYLIEEMFELVDAIEADDTQAVQEELGDVLFQVMFVAALYHESGRFSLKSVLEQVLQKMIRRHPHVFGDETVTNSAEVRDRWRKIKQREKGDTRQSILDSVPSGMPALMRAFRISERAAGVGFEWPELSGVVEQVESEWQEFKYELQRLEDEGTDRTDCIMEFGDILFSMINLARLAKIHPETALLRSTQKFSRRFRQMEAMARELGRPLEDLPREKLEALWETAKSNG